MIARIRLKNWKSHLDSEFNFSNGVNALVGINGAGKSSVLDGISFALFGTFPNHTNKKVSLDDLIMGRPHEKDEAEIVLDFFSDGKKYSVLRKIKKGKGTIQAEIREDGNLIEVNPNGVTEHIEKILQVDYTLFSKAVYSEQNNIDYFLTIPKGKRMQHIDRMLRLDRFECVRESAGSIRNSIDIRRGEKMRLLAELNKEGVGDKVVLLKENISKSELDMELLKKELYSLMEEKEKIRWKVDEFENKEKKISALERRMEGLKSAHKEVRDGLNQKATITNSMSREDLAMQLETLRRESECLEKEIKSKKDVLEISRNHAAASNIEIRAITESIRELERVGAKCPICEADVGEDKKTGLRSSKEKRIIEIKNVLESAVKEVGSIREQIELMEKKQKDKIKEIERVNYKLEDFDTVERLKDKIKMLELDMQNLETEKIQVTEEIKQIDIKFIKADFEEKSQKVGGMQSKLISLEDSIRKDKVVLSDLEKRLEMVNRYQEEVEMASRMIGFLDSFVKSLKSTQEQLREEFTKSVNYIMGNVWNNLYPYGDFTDVRLAVNDGDYVLEIKNADNWVAVDGFASGGERSLACLALRVAFSLAFIPNLRWLILDEPTHNLDVNTIQKFSSVLRENMSKFVNQIFLITHESRLVEDVEGPVYKLERNKEINGVTQIIRI